MEVEEEGIPLSLKEEKEESVWWGRVGLVVPAVGWGRRYGRGQAAADLVAGLTLGLTLVPQSIAYAALADLPPQYGLYSSFVGTIVYVFMGTVKEVSIGPTSLMALLTLQICHHLTIHHVVLLTFLSGWIVLFMGLLRLGFLADLISPAVMNGFTSATALIIMISQCKGLLGLSFTAESLLENVTLISQHITETRLGDTLLALACCVVLLSLRKLKDIPVSPKRPALKKFLWLVSISRNALVICAASIIAFATDDHTASQHPYFKLSGRVTPGLPTVRLPAFSVPASNGTEAVGFPDMVRQLGAGLILVPAVMTLANIAIAKAFSSGGVDATQEMVTLGLCNVLGALVGAMPTCGAFTRSAVSHASGVRTPLAGLYSGMVTLVALAVMTPYFYYIPRACLSAVLVCAVCFMVDTERPRQLARDRRARTDLAALIVTFVAGCLISVEVALLLGVCVALCGPMSGLLRPPVRCRAHPAARALVCRVEGALLYTATDRVAATLLTAARLAPPDTRLLLIDCSYITCVDYTAKQMIIDVRKKLSVEGWTVALFGARGSALRQVGALQDTRTLTAPTVAQAARAAAPAHTALAPPYKEEHVALLTKLEDTQHQDDSDEPAVTVQ